MRSGERALLCTMGMWRTRHSYVYVRSSIDAQIHTKPKVNKMVGENNRQTKQSKITKNHHPAEAILMNQSEFMAESLGF